MRSISRKTELHKVTLIVSLKKALEMQIGRSEKTVWCQRCSKRHSLILIGLDFRYGFDFAYAVFECREDSRVI